MHDSLPVTTDMKACFRIGLFFFFFKLCPPSFLLSSTASPRIWRTVLGIRLWVVVPPLFCILYPWYSAEKVGQGTGPLLRGPLSLPSFLLLDSQKNAWMFTFSVFLGNGIYFLKDRQCNWLITNIYFDCCCHFTGHDNSTENQTQDCMHARQVLCT